MTVVEGPGGDGESRREENAEEQDEQERLGTTICGCKFNRQTIACLSTVVVVEETIFCVSKQTSA
jgi:hypothetical protein